MVNDCAHTSSDRKRVKHDSPSLGRRAVCCLYTSLCYALRQDAVAKNCPSAKLLAEPTMAVSLITRDWTATTFVVHQGRTLLLLHRKYGKWFPPGGHIDPHELPDVAALREVEEETGLWVALLDGGGALGPVRRLAQPICILLEEIAPGHEHIDLIYVARVIEGDLRHAPRESREARWYDVVELGGDEVPGDVCELGRQAIDLVQAWEASNG